MINTGCGIVLTTLSVLCFDYRVMTAFPMRSGLASYSHQVQENRVNLFVDDLSEPHVLRVRSASSLSYLSGSIFCNGRIIKHLKNGTTEVDIAPYLQAGKNSVSILGRYSPSITSIEVEFTGPNHQINQTTSGSGVINHNLVLDVQ